MLCSKSTFYLENVNTEVIINTEVILNTEVIIKHPSNPKAYTFIFV